MCDAHKLTVLIQGTKKEARKIQDSISDSENVEFSLLEPCDNKSYDNKEVEKIIAAAIMMNEYFTAMVPNPGRHADVIHELAKAGLKIPIKGAQGFITSTGRFVNRLDAKEVAIKAGQVTQTEFDELYSEDVW